LRENDSKAPKLRYGWGGKDGSLQKKIGKNCVPGGEATAGKIWAG
jgi:hypothetical protein